MIKTAYKIISVLTFSIWTLLGSAQQEPISTLFGNNLMQTNPAMTGALYKHSANIIWNDYLLRPEYNVPRQTTLWANYALKVDKINSGFGVSYRYDALGIAKRNTALFSYAYHIPIKSFFLSIGASVGVSILNHDYSELIFSTPVDEPIFKPGFTSDFGIALRQEKWRVGLSVTQLNNPTYSATNTAQRYTMPPHFWLFADYKFDLGEKWDLTPRIQFVTNQKQFSVNTQLEAKWNEQLWFGVGLKSTFINNESIMISPFVGYDIKSKFRIGYAANLSTVPDAYMHNHMTHELVLSFLMR